MNATVSTSTWKRILFAIFLVILVEAAWFFIVIYEYDRLPTDYEIHLEHEGENQIANDVFGTLSKPFKLKESSYQETIGTDGDVLIIRSVVEGVRADTGDSVFNSEKIYRVNRASLLHTDDNGRYFAFLPDVQKQNYEFLHPLTFVEGTLSFQNVETLHDLEVYVFESNTSSADISFAFPQFAPHVIFGDGSSKFWVEPITGNLIGYEKNWEAYALINGTQKQIVEKGWKHTTEFTESILADSTASEIQNRVLFKIIIPIFLGFLILTTSFVLILFKGHLKTQKKIIEKNHMESLANLTAQLAHDIRNPLSIILVSIENLKMKYGVNDSNGGDFDSIERAVNRIDYRINAVLDFIKGRTPKLNTVKSSKIIEDSTKSLIIPKDVKLIVPENDVDLLVDEHLFSSAISNLILNGIQAIDGKGEIVIGVDEKDDEITIQIKDSGKGIPKENITNIFEPMFTTKAKGIGIGLTGVKSTVEAHGGTISVTSPPTVFTIRLPKSNSQLYMRG